MNKNIRAFGVALLALIIWPALPVMLAILIVFCAVLVALSLALLVVGLLLIPASLLVMWPVVPFVSFWHEKQKS